ncbi:MAG: DUF3883 domain-containing protein [Planctomycetes bacterium]|nr:DUF3883 domain-containing protein [Planctomycetota bacterium]
MFLSNGSVPTIAEFAVCLEVPKSALCKLALEGYKYFLFIEVKSRAGVAEVALSTNEYRSARRLGGDYWLHVVQNCAETRELHPIWNSARLDWKQMVRLEHFHLGASTILEATRE